MKLIPYTLLIALLSFSHLASAADKPTQQSDTTVQNGGAGQLHMPKSTVLHVSGGLCMVPIGETFFALLPEIPTKLETPQDFLTNRITGVAWEITDSRGLGDEHKFGLSLRSPVGSKSEIPSFIHVSGLPKAFELKATAHFKISDSGNLVVTIGKSQEAYPVILKEDMQIKTASTTSVSGAGLASTKPGQ